MRRATLWCHITISLGFITWPGCVDANLYKEEDQIDLAQCKTIKFHADEFTATNLDVSPDGTRIVFDLLGDIYAVPINGGEAVRILAGVAWEQSPRYSADGHRIAFISDRSGSFRLWSMDGEGGGLRCYEAAGAVGTQCLPVWFDGKPWLPLRGVAVPASHHDGTLRIDEATAAFDYQGITDVSHDGRYAYASGITRHDLVSGKTVDIAAGSKPRLSPDGQCIAYAHRIEGSPTTLRLRKLDTGEERDYGEYGQEDRDIGVSGFAFTPDGRHLITTANGKIVRVNLENGRRSIIPILAPIDQTVSMPPQLARRIALEGVVSCRALRWLSISSDGGHGVFQVLGKIYQVPTAGSLPRRITEGGLLEYYPSISPLGDKVAYTTWSDANGGNVMIVSPGGEPISLTREPGRYASPTWSPSGDQIAFLADADAASSSVDGSGPLQLRVVNIRTGESTCLGFVERGYEPARFNPPIVFSTDGKRIYVSGRMSRTRYPPLTGIKSFAIDGSESVDVLRVDGAIDELVISPDARRVAVAWRGKILVAHMVKDLSAESVLPLELEGGNSPFRTVSYKGGTYLSWQNAETLTWMEGNQPCRWRRGREVERLSPLIVSHPRAVAGAKVAYINARIVTMRGKEIIENGSMVVSGGRITHIGSNVLPPDDATIMDLKGATVIPGLIDVHDHLNRGEREIFPEQKWEYVANLAYGVTTSFDPAAMSTDVFALAECVDAGLMIGPRIYSTGSPLYADSDNHPAFRHLSTPAEAARAVSASAHLGALMIKEYAFPRRSQRQWIVAAARASRVAVTAEGRTRSRAITHVIDGYTSIEHGMWSHPLFADTIRFLGESQIHFTPTLLVPDVLFEEYFYALEDLDSGKRLKRFVPPFRLQKVERYRITLTSERRAKKLRNAEDIARLARAGVQVSVGAHGQLPGLGTHWEMWAMALGGLDNHSVLRAATIVGARKLGLDADLGSLETGKAADFLVLLRDPLADIRNTVAIQYVSSRGFLYNAETMARILPTMKPCPNLRWRMQKDTKGDQ